MGRLDKVNKVVRLWESDLNKGKRYELMMGYIGVMDLVIGDIYSNVRNGVVKRGLERGYSVVFEGNGVECLMIYNK